MPITAAINEEPQEAIRGVVSIGLDVQVEAAEKESLKGADGSTASDGITVGATRNGTRNFKRRSGSQKPKKSLRQTSGTTK